VNPRCRGRPLYSEFHACVIYFGGDFAAVFIIGLPVINTCLHIEGGIFSNGNILLIFAAKEQYNLQASSWGLGGGVKGGKRARIEIFFCRQKSGAFRY